jgi:L-threonylcarbamoyladenylate synthase
LWYTVVKGKSLILGWCRMVSAELPPALRQQINKGVSILKSGGIVAFPTDTVYGLGASADIPGAVARVYMVKGRPRNMPMPLLLARVSQIEDVAESVPPLAWLLAKKFLPGALTLVLTKSRAVSDIVTGGSETVAVRIPAHPVPVALASGLGVPLLGTSANLSGRKSALTAGEVSAQFGEQVDLVVDGGPSPGGRESTIVDVTGEVPVVLREGAVSLSELEQAGGIVFKKAS